MRIAIVVGLSYKDMTSVKRYIERNITKDDTLVFLEPVQTTGELLARRAGERLGIPVDHVLVGSSPLEKLEARVFIVKNVDKLVLFDDGSTRLEHFYNLAEVNKKELVHFIEVKHGLKH